MTKKYYRVDINVTSTTWETAVCYIPAESEEEARKIFDADDHTCDWDNWETHDSEVRNWDVENVEYDEGMTQHMEEQYERARIETLENEQETKDDTSM